MYLLDVLLLIRTTMRRYISNCLHPSGSTTPESMLPLCRQKSPLLLRISLQSNKEFSSYMLNRDSWGNEAVAQPIRSNFIFRQVYDETTEGKKVCTYYKVASVPVVLCPHH